MRSSITWLCALVFAASGCSGSQPLAGQDAPDSAVTPTTLTTEFDATDDVEDVDDPLVETTPDSTQLLQAALDDWEPDADGGAVVFARTSEGAAYSLATGIDPRTGELLEPDARVRVGSISKTVTAVLVLMLVEEGLVELSEPISSYLPDLETASDPTVAQLLGHRSGIPNYTEAVAFGAVVLGNPRATPTPTDLVAYAGVDADFDPGARYSYSNTNYVIAGMLVEAVTKRSLGEVFRDRVTDPLGFGDTVFDDGSTTAVAGGHSGITVTGNSYQQPYVSVAYGSWAAGGLVTTVTELATFLDEVFFGELLSVESRALLVGDVQEGAEYGLGLHGGPDFGVGHGGSIVGFNSLAQVDPVSGQMLIVVVNNDERRPSVLSRELAAILEGS